MIPAAERRLVHLEHFWLNLYVGEHLENCRRTADGNWNLVVTTPMGERHGTLSLKTDGTTPKGSQMADGNSTEIFDGTVNGNEISWKVFDHRPNANDAHI
jgi:hypothetical protein